MGQVPLSVHGARAGATKTKTKEKVDTKTAPKTQRPWNVVVHDDPVSLMTYVTRVFMDVFKYPQAKAHRLMLEVHHAGRSVVWSGARESAETYAAKLKTYHLTTTLEPGSDDG